MPRIHKAAMADLRKQKEEQEAKQKKMFGRPVTDREPLSNFRSGKWRKVLADREEKTGKAPTFRFASRTKVHEILLEHEKKSRVSRSRVRKMVDYATQYVPAERMEVKSTNVEPEDNYGIASGDANDATEVRTHMLSLRAASQSGPPPLASPDVHSVATPFGLGSPASTIERVEQGPESGERQKQYTTSRQLLSNNAGQPCTGSLNPESASNSQLNSIYVDTKSRGKGRNQTMVRHKRTITAHAGRPRVNLLTKQPAGALLGEEDLVTHDEVEYRNKDEVLNYFFKDVDEEIFHEQEVGSVSTATRDKKTATVQNYPSRNQRAADQMSGNYSSKQSTYFVDQKMAGSRLSSMKGGQSLKVLSSATTAAKSRPQTSYGPKFPTRKPYFVRFQERRSGHAMRNDPSLKQSITHKQQSQLNPHTSDRPSDGQPTIDR